MQYLKTNVTDLLGVEHPVLQDGMGPFDTVRLAASVSNAGGMGSVSMPALAGDPDVARRTIQEHIKRVADLTDKPFAVNIGVGIDKKRGTIIPVCEAMLDGVLEASADGSMSGSLRTLTTSGGFPGAFLEQIQSSDLVHLQKVGSTHQAKKAAAAGVDGIIASGYEMGGHTHMQPVHTFVLVPNVTEAVDIPVILSGGARDARTLAAALALGAGGIGMGTRFIVTDENDWHEAYKERIVAATEGDDTLFPAWFSDARALKGSGIDRLMAKVNSGELDAEELGAFKSEALRLAQQDGDLVDGIVACGQVASGIHSVVSVADFVPDICREASEILASQSRLLANP